jgi:hypothetical protein
MAMKTFLSFRTSASHRGQHEGASHRPTLIVATAYEFLYSVVPVVLGVLTSSTRLNRRDMTGRTIFKKS